MQIQLASNTTEKGPNLTVCVHPLAEEIRRLNIEILQGKVLGIPSATGSAHGIGRQSWESKKGLIIGTDLRLMSLFKMATPAEQDSAPIKRLKQDPAPTGHDELSFYSRVGRMLSGK